MRQTGDISYLLTIFFVFEDLLSLAHCLLENKHTSYSIVASLLDFLCYVCANVHLPTLMINFYQCCYTVNVLYKVTVL